MSRYCPSCGKTTRDYGSTDDDTTWAVVCNTCELKSSIGGVLCFIFIMAIISFLVYSDADWIDSLLNSLT